MTSTAPLTARPTFSHFLLRSAWRMAPLRLFTAPVVPAIMVLYKLKVIDRDRLTVWMWRYGSDERIQAGSTGR